MDTPEESVNPWDLVDALGISTEGEVAQNGVDRVLFNGSSHDFKLVGWKVDMLGYSDEVQLGGSLVGRGCSLVSP